MWRFLLLLAVSFVAFAGDEHPTLAIGSPAPDFSLPGIDGRTHQLSDYANSPILVIVFTHLIGAFLYVVIRRPERIRKYGR